MYEWIVPVTDVVVVGLLLLLGGNLGSFLNVVVHRVPRGESVVHGGSHCPSCGSAIRWYDNVPVLGWLRLRGRCRDCGVLIAARYPLLEAVGALLIGGVAAAELLSGGRTLPGTAFGVNRPGADNLLLRPDPLLIAVAVLHGWLLFHLLVLAAVEADGRLVPTSWCRLALAITAGIVIGWPSLVPLGIGPRHAEWFGGQLGRGLLVTAVGMACGALVGRRAAPAVRQGLMLVGAALGWQAAAGVAVLLPCVGWLRGGLASLVPPDPPPATPTGLADSPTAPTRSIQSEAATAPETPVESTKPADGTLPSGEEDRSRPPSSVPPAGAFLVRLTAPVIGYLREKNRIGGDLVVSAALVLLVWRWVWVGVTSGRG